MSAENRHSFPPLPENHSSFSLPIFDTYQIISHMPEERWELPESPFTNNRQAIIAAWIPALDKADVGRWKVDRFAKEGVLSGDLYNIQLYNFFHYHLKPKMEEKNINSQQAIASVRNAFLNLLTPQQAQELGHQKPQSINQEDVENAKHLIKSLMHISPDS